MRKKMIDGDPAFVGRTLRCPMCGHWLVKSCGLFGRLILVDGEIVCGECGTKITFGDQERLARMQKDAQENENQEVRDCFNCLFNEDGGTISVSENDEPCWTCLKSDSFPNWEERQ